MYWSQGPVEWSPIGNENASSTPLTAMDYLRSKPLAPEVPPDKPSQLEPALDKDRKKEEKTPDSRLKKLLPVLVVILLLIGLIAALLSSFLFPGPSSGGGASAVQPVAGTGSREEYVAGGIEELFSRSDGEEVVSIGRIPILKRG